MLREGRKVGALSLRLLLGKPTNSLPQRGIEFGVLEERVFGGRQDGVKIGPSLVGPREDFLKEARRTRFD